MRASSILVLSGGSSNVRVALLGADAGLAHLGGGASPAARRVEHSQSTDTNGEDLPEIRNRQWSPSR